MVKDSEKTKKKVSHHDAIFKFCFSHPQFARELFQLVFTEEERAAFDWNDLRPEKDTFSDSMADLLFSVPFKDEPNKRARLCLLLEHKSRFSPEVYYQILKYSTNIIGESLKKHGETWLVMTVVFYHGKKPWKWPKSLKNGLWKNILSKIPSSLKRNLLDCEIRVLDTSSPEVERAVRDEGIKSRGFLWILKKIWFLKSGKEEELKKAISLFDNWTGDRQDLVLNVGGYLWSTVRGMTKELWKSLEIGAVKRGIFPEGGYMNIREHIREEGMQAGIQKGRQEGRQEGIQKVVLNMLQNDVDMPLICKVTGLSEKEIKKLQNGN